MAASLCFLPLRAETLVPSACQGLMAPWHWPWSWQGGYARLWSQAPQQP